MKKVLSIFFLIFYLLRLSVPVLAQKIDPGSNGEAAPDNPKAITTSFSSWSRYFMFVTGTSEFDNVGEILTKLLPYLFTLAGFILLIMLLMGGFQYLTSGSSPEAAEAGKKRITTALTGFVIVFSAYWIAQIVSAILGVPILGGV